MFLDRREYVSSAFETPQDTEADLSTSILLHLQALLSTLTLFLLCKGILPHLISQVAICSPKIERPPLRRDQQCVNLASERGLARGWRPSAIYLSYRRLRPWQALWLRSLDEIKWYERGRLAPP